MTVSSDNSSPPPEISIHTSPEGSDKTAVADGYGRKEFQSTLPLREVTICELIGVLNLVVFQSTLPLREVTIAAKVVLKIGRAHV